MDKQAALAIIKRHNALWGTQLSGDDDEFNEFRNSLLALHYEDEQAALHAYDVFCDGWSRHSRIPRPADVLRGLRRQQPARSPLRPRRSNRRCALCGDTGQMRIAAPRPYCARDVGGVPSGLVPAREGFNPPHTFVEAKVYRVSVPCICSRGKAIEQRRPLSDGWKALRDKWAGLMRDSDRGHMIVNDYICRCTQKRQEMLCIRAEKHFEEERQQREVEDVPEDEIPF